MKKRNSMIVLAIFIAVVVLGVGYATVSAVNLTISGTAAVKDTDLKVFFTGTPTTDVTGASTGATATATSVEEGLTATIAVTDLQAVNDTVTATYNIKNNEGSLSASILKESITNTKDEFFEVTTSVDSTPLVLTKGSTGTVTVTVKLIKVPVESTDSSTNITVVLHATPVQP